MRRVVHVEKLRDYLLDLDHSHGGPKARFFRRVGFSTDGVGEFARALTQHTVDNDIQAVLPTTHGTKYRIECHIQTPDGRNACVISVWMDDDSRGEEARFVTAYPR